MKQANLGCGSMKAASPLLARARLEGRRSRTLLNSKRSSKQLRCGGFCVPLGTRYSHPVVT